MLAMANGIEDLTLTLTQEIYVEAPLETTFEALLEQLGEANVKPDGTPMPLVLEPWPGGRWYRDLGEENGHWWGNVQAINRPVLLEMAGPLFMSYAAANNVQYRLSEVEGGTMIKFRHSGIGLFEAEHKKGVHTGWSYIHDKVKRKAEAAK
ncbi:MAG: SRPBCC domain-containing protein [Edaphobacter sp.]|uniref:SRPBCC family protein n=1 Tax=Edaphobacter sp. TaxID=1934404 RepID=UPI0023915E11|nr:SRPBCC domain-containing protein [Edaphobacter sp.]MDE1178824.1 SRPBCC domain-containing protein [Edaphobacter sp.]